ncbi:hypothetical protein R6Q59_034501 [Mikania micrantha]|uniref:Uncharacterized protein n=1 Tax=Mikania micrantha TaxID=192012 RepID=A0A5N6NHC5_9ASTR|nr:hypothetical protein E3N88_20564 [Mikania micrantha]
MSEQRSHDDDDEPVGDSLLINPDQSGSEVGDGKDLKDVDETDIAYEGLTYLEDVSRTRRLRFQRDDNLTGVFAYIRWWWHVWSLSGGRYYFFGKRQPRTLYLKVHVNLDGDLDFGLDTNKHDYFNFTAFNLHGDDNLSGVSTYGGGDMSGQAVDISLNNVISVSNSVDHGGDGSQLISLPKFGDTNNGGSDKTVEKLEQERDGGQVVVQERGGGEKSDWWWRRFGGNRMVEEMVAVVGLVEINLK